MARTIVFPSRNNVTYRSGWIKLTAFGSEFDQAAIEGDTQKAVESLKNTNRVYTPEFAGGGIDYLKNAISNMKEERKMMGGEVKLVCVMPIPLAIKDQTAVEWASAPSAFIDGAYGAVKDMGTGQASTYAAFSTIGDMASNAVVSEGSAFSNLGSKGLDLATSMGMLANHNNLTELLINGNSTLAKSAAQHPAIQAVVKPGPATKQILGMNSNASIRTFHNEAAALNGRRQIIFDPGYWQSFQGVNPRGFTLSWEIIPENHEDAINGLELCSRIREFSLPQSVSGVELLSPCYWQIEWSNEYLEAQTLYSNLVVNDVSVDYAERGEWHGASTPKMFKINIQFMEAKAPTSNLYKDQPEFIPIDLAASQSTGRSRGRSGPTGFGGITNGGNVGGSGGNSGNSGNSGVLGDLGRIFGGNSGNSGGIFSPGSQNNGGVLGKIKTQTGNSLGGILGGIISSAGDKAGDILGKMMPNEKIGDWIDDQIDKAADKASKVVVDAVKTGDFSNIGSKIKDVVVGDIKDEAVVKAGEVIGGILGNKVGDVLGKKFPQVDLETIKDILIKIQKGEIPLDEAMEILGNLGSGKKILGVLGGLTKPEYVGVLEKVNIKLPKNP